LKTYLGITSGLLFSFLLTIQGANAAGFYLSEYGTPGSTGTAGVANPTNNFGTDYQVRLSISPVVALPW
jgi:hypothetical protein